MNTVHLVVPEGIDDPMRPSGGNTFDRRMRSGLAEAGWCVRVHEVRGHADLASSVARLPDGAIVLVDGLVASAAADVLVPAAKRLRLVVLVHMPFRTSGEGSVLSAAHAVIATSSWTRRLLMRLYSLPGERVHVARPGVDPVELAPGTAAGGALLSVSAVIPGKGHDLLVDALAKLADLRWRWDCVGSLERDPAFAGDVRRRVLGGAIHDRVRFTGPQSGGDLARSYGAADVLVLPSRAETYGMVVTEALARGVPVVAAHVGGVPEALGRASDGTPPGLLVPPDDAAALGDALRAWLRDADLRRRLRRAARERRASLLGWSTTTSVVADVLVGAAR